MSPDVADGDPRATYRLQLHPGFTFADAERLGPYLAALGVSHAYLSPVLQAAPGSTHGYDVVDPRRVNEELGGETGFERLASGYRERGLRLLVDIVPNHMAIGSGQNPWWRGVLEDGLASRYARHFDVDWQHPEAHLRDRVLLPMLGDHYGRVLEAGELRIEWDGNRFGVRYHEQRLPLSARSLDELLGLAASRAGSDELGFLAGAFGDLPPSTATDPSSVERRQRDKEVLLHRLADLARNDPAVGEAIEAAVAATNADPDALDRLLERQNYRLAWWRAARRDLGYRRFFDVTTLVGLRTEDERVFEDTHALVLGWLADGVVDGVRVDHPDGLRDPEAYFRRLRWASPRAWIVAEKILATDEELRRSWPIDGTTGYDFLNEAQRVLLDPAGEAPLDELYRQFTGDEQAWDEISFEARRLVLRDVLGSELGRLTGLLLDLLERHRRHRDHTRHDLHEAVRALLASMPVYRTYVRPASFASVGPASPGDGHANGMQLPTAGPGTVAAEDEAAIRVAVERAKERLPEVPADLFDVIGDVLLLRVTGDLESEFVARFQQLSGAVMAKGIEDTAMYRFLRLVALDEVGGDPGRWSDDVETFHARAAARRDRWPRSLLATMTHDTKRSGDVRARLLVLAQRPAEWAAAVTRWSGLAARHRTAEQPDRATEFLLWQTLVGAWPIDAARLNAYLTKAIREARVRTSWTEPDASYEAAVAGFAGGVLDDTELVADVAAFVSSILAAGRRISLAQTLLKLTAPGIPDLYQGSELWDLSLVDPDNRRPVDFELRERILESIDGCSPEELVARLADPHDPGTPKLFLIRAALAARARHPEAFGSRSTYQPLPGRGLAAEHVVAFSRSDAVAVVVPRAAERSGDDGWRGARLDLPAARWRNVLTNDPVEGGERSLAELLARFPVALLERDPLA